MRHYVDERWEVIRLGRRFVPRDEPGAARLVLLRGNSGSGKSSIARAVRDRYGRGLAIVEQDYLRRVLLRERDLPGGNTGPLLDQTVRFALGAGYHVLCEGILQTSVYAEVLHRLVADHPGRTDVFYLDVALEETFRRHTTRPQATEFGPEDMRRWYSRLDLLGVPGEQVIDEHTSLDTAADLIAARLPRVHDHLT